MDLPSTFALLALLISTNRYELRKTVTIRPFFRFNVTFRGPGQPPQHFLYFFPLPQGRTSLEHPGFQAVDQSESADCENSAIHYPCAVLLHSVVVLL